MLAVGCLLGFIVDVDGLACRLYPEPPTKLTANNCQMLRNGMSRLQVVALVGGRGELIDTRRLKLSGHIVTPKSHCYLGLWKGSEIHLSVWFDPEGTVAEAWYETQPGGELKTIPKLYEKP